MRFRLAERRSFVSVGHRLTNPTTRAFLCFSPIRLLHLIEESFGILLMHSRSGWGQLPTAPRRVESCACSKERNFWPGKDASVAVAGSGVGKLNESWAFVFTAFITKTNRTHTTFAWRPNEWREQEEQVADSWSFTNDTQIYDNDLTTRWMMDTIRTA